MFQFCEAKGRGIRKRRSKEKKEEEKKKIIEQYKLTLTKEYCFSMSAHALKWIFHGVPD